MKRLAIIILSAVILNLALTVMPAGLNFSVNGVASTIKLSSTTSEKDSSKKSKAFEDLSEHQFNVTENLDLSGDNQNMDYFEEGETATEQSRSPIVKFTIRIIDFAMKVIGSIAMIILIIGGFMMMVANGNQQTIDNAKEVVKYAAIGLAVAFLSYTIILFLQTLFTKA